MTQAILSFHEMINDSLEKFGCWNNSSISCHDSTFEDECANICILLPIGCIIFISAFEQKIVDASNCSEFSTGSAHFIPMSYELKPISKLDEIIQMLWMSILVTSSDIFTELLRVITKRYEKDDWWKIFRIMHCAEVSELTFHHMHESSETTEQLKNRYIWNSSNYQYLIPATVLLRS